MFKRNKGGVDAYEAAKLVAGGSLVVDVREQEEWDAGRIPGAVHVPLGELGERHGQHAIRSKLTQRNGATEVEGGFVAWRENGLPVAHER